MSTSLCKAGEAVVFSCQLGAPTVSLCTNLDAAGQIDALTFRLGTAARIEREFVASKKTGQHFSATVSPAEPGALVRQVWFDQDGSRTLLTECVGGNCPQAAGLAVLRSERVVSNKRCLRTADDAAWFSNKLVLVDCSGHN